MTGELDNASRGQLKRILAEVILDLQATENARGKAGAAEEVGDFARRESEEFEKLGDTQSAQRLKQIADDMQNYSKKLLRDGEDNFKPSDSSN